MNFVILKISIIIQVVGIFGIIGAAYYFATMSGTNMRWRFFLPLWGIPSLFQMAFILRDLFVLKMTNRVLIIKKFHLFLILPYFLFYKLVVILVLEKLFPYPVWDDDKLTGIGEYVLYFFFVLPYFGYLYLCLAEWIDTKNNKDDLKID